MTEAKIVVGETTYSSLDDVVAARKVVANKLIVLFAGFNPPDIGALHKFEPDIVRLFNRYQQLSEAIDRQNIIEQRNQNIRTAWSLVHELKKDNHS